jgi:hypothetical protein
MGMRAVKWAIMICVLIGSAWVVSDLAASAGSAPSLDCGTSKVVVEISNLLADSGGRSTEREALEAFSDDISAEYPDQIATAQEVDASIQEAIDADTKSESGGWLLKFDGAYRAEVSVEILPDGTFSVHEAILC